jgi:prepilin-type N-terminal cleavage/methylation domain-containing protein
MKTTRHPAGFTLLELLVVIAMIALGASILVPALARTRPNSQAFKCLDNLRQLTAAWSMYNGDYNNSLLTCENGISGRVNWCTGVLSFSATSLNWDVNQAIARSPLWSYTGSNAAAFKCPADQSAVSVNGVWKPRVRSYSMSQAFSTGTWLDKAPNPGQTVWRTYANGAQIVIPARTFLFVDEHPSSINDSAFANVCTGAQPTDPPSAAQIIDFPASAHHGAGGFSFTDGHLEMHKWLGSTIKPPPSNSYLALNVTAGDSWMDIQWLAQNTTVKR